MQLQITSKIDGIFKNGEDIIIHYGWYILNPELKDMAYYGAEFPFETHEVQAQELDSLAKSELFNIINNEFPNVYTL